MRARGASQNPGHSEENNDVTRGRLALLHWRFVRLEKERKKKKENRHARAVTILTRSRQNSRQDKRQDLTCL